MKRWFIFIACLWASQASAQGTYTAASCSQSAVSAAITAEQAHPVDGDIISIPAGSCTWNAGITVTFTRSVTIQGAGAISSTAGGASTTGTDQTVIFPNTGGNSAFQITTTAGKSFRFTGIAVLENASSGSQGAGNVVIDGQSSSVRVDHSHFLIFIGGSKGLAFTEGVTGVADHLYVNTTQGVTNNFDILNGGNWQGDTDPNHLGNKSWVDTDHFGTSQYIYVEDSRITGGYLGDCSNGGRYVLRYSTVLDTHGMANHGTAGDSPWRGCRAAEFYQNTFNLNGTEGGGITHNNGGSTLIWGNNVVAGYYHVIDLNDVRVNGPYTTDPPPTGWGWCGTGHTGVTSVWDQNTTSSGYACLDQPGRGAGDLLTGYPLSSVLNVTAGNIRTWPHQALVPIYVWANTLSGTAVSIVGDNTQGLLADNRDYYQQFGTYGESGSFNGTKGVGQGLLSARPSTCTAGPGGNTPGVGYWATDTNTLYVCNPTNTWMVYYTPYTYPHPLTQSSGGTPPTPPTGLVATPH